jgi:hypothetical protein
LLIAEPAQNACGLTAAASGSRLFEPERSLIEGRRGRSTGGGQPAILSTGRINLLDNPLLAELLKVGISNQGSRVVGAQRPGPGTGGPGLGSPEPIPGAPARIGRLNSRTD